MKTVVILAFLAGLGYGIGQAAGKAEAMPYVPNSVASIACDPDVYDMIYKGIIQSAINSNLTTQAFKARNDGIETLRALCHGQRSKWDYQR
jgi:hypothetical protein